MTESPLPFLRLGLLGHPVGHSFSPFMHKAAMAYCGIAGEYDLIDVRPEKFDHAFALLKTQYSGFNVTIPHKQTVMRCLDELTPEANAVGAVNTIRLEHSGRAVGHNTDVGGLLAALSRAYPDDLAELNRALIIGSGGAARAALRVLGQLGTKQVVIVARSQRESRKLIDDFKRHNEVRWDVLLRTTGEPLNSQAPQLLINCTSIGLTLEPVPSWYGTLLQNCLGSAAAAPFFFDMVYSNGKEETALVKLARQQGMYACDGLQMLIEQALLAFEFWTGIKVPNVVMASSLPS